jgi:hypothetical protein
LHSRLRLLPKQLSSQTLLPALTIDAARVLRPTLPLILNSAGENLLAEQQARFIGIGEIAPKSPSELI